jgi:hypothetical protein
LFEEETWRKTFQVIPKLPYSFSYRFADADGRESELQVLDWEAGALYWKCLRRYGNEEIALRKVRAKYFDEFGRKDLHFFLGTTQQFHFVAPNPWIVVGVFPVPRELQMDLLQSSDDLGRRSVFPPKLREKSRPNAENGLPVPRISGLGRSPCR